MAMSEVDYLNLGKIDKFEITNPDGFASQRSSGANTITINTPAKARRIIIGAEENVWDGMFLYVIDVEKEKYNKYIYYNGSPSSNVDQNLSDISSAVTIADNSVTVAVGTLINGTTVITEAWVLVYC